MNASPSVVATCKAAEAWHGPRGTARAIEMLCVGEHTCALLLQSNYDALQLAGVAHRNSVFAAATTVANYAEVSAGVHRHAARIAGEPSAARHHTERAASLEAVAGRLHELAQAMVN